MCLKMSSLVKNNLRGCSKIFVSLPSSRHPEDASPKDLLFWFFEKLLKNRRFFAGCRMTNKVIVNMLLLSLSSWGRKAEGSPLLIFYLKRKIGDSSLRSEWRCGFLEHSSQGINFFLLNSWTYPLTVINPYVPINTLSCFFSTLFTYLPFYFP